MIDEFVEKWYKYKDDLENYFTKTKQEEYSKYGYIVKALFKYIINKDIEYGKYDIEDIKIIDDGDYQGTQIFILHKDTYQPDIDEYVYTSVYYGSCSGCDTLLSISGYVDDVLPTEEQVKNYMTLSLHLLQKCRYFEE